MKTIKIKYSNKIPRDYTGIVEWENGDKSWYKNGKWHREDGPARIHKDGYKSWYLDGKYVCSSTHKFDLRNKIILSKEKHSKYSTIQVWKILDKDKIYEQIVIPGMEECIIE